MKILVVDDELQRDFVKSALVSNGHEVVIAESEEEVLGLLKTTKGINRAITDWLLHGDDPKFKGTPC